MASKKTQEGKIEVRILSDVVHPVTGEILRCNTVAELDAEAVSILEKSGAADSNPEAVKAAKAK